jgi:glycosyltransferase involved in cell wall biosynthesis
LTGTTPLPARSLYLCYFGLREPLVQTQVLPYLRAVAASGVAVTLLTFEPKEPGWAPAEVDAATRSLAATGIRWQRRRYHKRPAIPATALDVAVGTWLVRQASRRAEVDLLHARGHLPALMAALGARGRSAPLVLFDDRGFMPEEYVDAGLWKPGGVVFRAMKAIERRMLRRADAVVVLTERARDLLAPQLAGRPGGPPPLEVIPCCVDLAGIPAPTAAGKAAAKRRLGVGERPVALYVGSTTGCYRFDELVAFVMALRHAEPDLYLLVLTQRDVGPVSARLLRHGFAKPDFSVRAVAPTDVAAWAAAADVGLAFIEPTYAKQASSPTKIAEYLACGLPVVVTAGIGDLDAQLTGAGAGTGTGGGDEDGDAVGVLVHRPDEAGHRQAVDELRQLLRDPGLAGRCRAAAAALFDLETVGGPRYVGIYQRLLGTASA